MEDLTKIKIDVKDGVASIIDLTPEQAQEIWDRCATVEGTKRFSRKGIESLIIKIQRLKETLHYEVPEKYPDNCQVCFGDHGGVRGNENIINGIVTCDYCHCDQMDKDRKNK